MESLSTFAAFGSLAVTVIIGLLLRSYLPGYLAEKSKNLASKEDIAHITKLVEGAKADYAIALEHQKAALAAELERHKATLAGEGQVMERRRKVYEEICAGLRVFVKGHSSSEEAKERLYAAYASAWLWASDDVLSELNRFLAMQLMSTAAPGSVPQEVMKRSYAEIILRMRKDSGFPSVPADVGTYQFVYF